METHILHNLHDDHKPFSSPREKASRLVGKTILSAIVLGVLVILLGSVYLWNVYDQKITPNTAVENLDLGNKTKEEASSFLLAEVTVPEYDIVIIDSETEFATTSAWLKLTPEINTAVDRAFTFGHEGSMVRQIWERWLSFFGYKHVFPITYSYNDQQLATWIEEISQNVFVAGEHPEAVWVGSTYRINSGQYGQRLDDQKLLDDIQNTLGKQTTLSLPLEVTHTPLSATGVIHAEQRLETIRSLTINLKVSENESTKKLTPAEFFPWLMLPEGYKQASMSDDLAEISTVWNRPPEDAIFELDENDSLIEFNPDKPGRAIQLSELVSEVMRVLSTASSHDPQAQEKYNTNQTITVPVTETPAKVQLKDINSLGIDELIGRGTSTFFGSIPNRVFNVELTSNRLHPTLIKPGEEFSFNRAVGEVSASTGYKSAYVIQNGRTVLGDGGGVCQVSTTVFRAILDAGLPITQWKAHSYRVGYYEQNTEPGFDATVYSPSVDLKFKNDTEHAVVVSTMIDVPNRFLVVEIWGTSDGRTSTISDYTAWNQRSAPAPLYQDDPSLPRGTTRQIDWAAPGLNTQFTYTVSDKNGEQLHTRKFTSYFRPWQAVYLVGTGE